MGQLEGLSFQGVLEKYPDRKVELPSYKTMMNNARRTKPLSVMQARNVVISATEHPWDYDPRESIGLGLAIHTPLKVYMVGDAPGVSWGVGQRVVIGNVTVPSGVRMVERHVTCRGKNADKTVIGFEVTTVDAHSFIELDPGRRWLWQVGALLRKQSDPAKDDNVWLGTNVARPTRPYLVFVDQGNALRYAAIKR